MYKPTEDAMLVYDTGEFHAEEGCVVQPVWLGYPALWCVSCRVVGHLDLVGRHVTVESGKVARSD